MTMHSWLRQHKTRLCALVNHPHEPVLPPCMKQPWHLLSKIMAVVSTLMGKRGARKKPRIEMPGATEAPVDVEQEQLQLLATPCTGSVLEARTQAVLPHTQIMVGQELGHGTYGVCYAARLPLMTPNGAIIKSASDAPLYQTDWVALKVFDMSEKDAGSDGSDARTPPLDDYIENELSMGIKTAGCEHVVGLRMHAIEVGADVGDPLYIDGDDLRASPDSGEGEEEEEEVGEPMVGPFLFPEDQPPAAPLHTRVFVMPLYKMDLHAFQGKAVRCRLSTVAYYRTMMQLLWQVAKGLDELHSRQIAHLDLKPTNILVQYSHGAWHAAISDFTIAVHLPHISVCSSHSNCTLAKIATAMQSPEQSIDMLTPSFPTDVWCWGLIAISMLSPSNSPMVTCEIENAAREHARTRMSFSDAPTETAVLSMAYRKCRKRGWMEVWEDPGLFLIVPNPFVFLKRQFKECYNEYVWEIVQSALRCSPEHRITARQLATASEQWKRALCGTVTLDGPQRGTSVLGNMGSE